MTTHLRIIPFALLSIFLLAACGGGDDEATPTSGRVSPPPPPARPQPTAAATAVQQDTSGGVPGDGTPVTVINEDAGGVYKFNPSELSFKVGEKVTFTLQAETEFHTFTVEDLGIDESLEAGETHPFTFTFNQPGSFRLICLAHPEMTGTITVQ
jgi:plastocyanin